MLDRREFLGMLAALPVVSKVAPKVMPESVSKEVTPWNKLPDEIPVNTENIVPVLRWRLPRLELPASITEAYRDILLEGEQYYLTPNPKGGYTLVMSNDIYALLCSTHLGQVIDKHPIIVE